MNHITSSQGLADLVEAYHQHLLQTRGLAPGTGAYYVRHVRAFLTEQWKASSHDLDLSRLDAPTLVGYFADQRRHLDPSALQRRATSLRSFLRFLALSGQAAAALVEAVPKIQTGPR